MLCCIGPAPARVRVRVRLRLRLRLRVRLRVSPVLYAAAPGVCPHLRAGGGRVAGR